MNVLKGYNGSVILDDEQVTLTRKGLGRVGTFKGVLNIPLSEIQEVQIRPATRLRNGYIRFLVAGANPAPLGTQANGDKYSILFTHKHRAEAAAMKEAVDRVHTA